MYLKQSCYFHKNHYIQKFCARKQCTLPLCQQCLKIHFQQHKNLNQQPNVIQYGQAYEKTYKSLEGYLQKGRNQYKERVESLRKDKQQAVRVIQSYFMKYEEQFAQEYRRIQQIQVKYQKLKKGSIKPVIYYFSDQIDLELPRFGAERKKISLEIQKILLNFKQQQKNEEVHTFRNKKQTDGQFQNVTIDKDFGGRKVENGKKLEGKGEVKKVMKQGRVQMQLQVKKESEEIQQNKNHQQVKVKKERIQVKKQDYENKKNQKIVKIKQPPQSKQQLPLPANDKQNPLKKQIPKPQQVHNPSARKNNNAPYLHTQRQTDKKNSHPHGNRKLSSTLSNFNEHTQNHRFGFEQAKNQNQNNQYQVISRLEERLDHKLSTDKFYQQEKDNFRYMDHKHQQEGRFGQNHNLDLHNKIGEDLKSYRNWKDNNRLDMENQQDRFSVQRDYLINRRHNNTEYNQFENVRPLKTTDLQTFISSNNFQRSPSHKSKKFSDNFNMNQNQDFRRRTFSQELGFRKTVSHTNLPSSKKLQSTSNINIHQNFKKQILSPVQIRKMLQKKIQQRNKILTQKKTFTGGTLKIGSGSQRQRQPLVQRSQPLSNLTNKFQNFQKYKRSGGGSLYEKQLSTPTSAYYDRFQNQNQNNHNHKKFTDTYNNNNDRSTTWNNNAAGQFNTKDSIINRLYNNNQKQIMRY